MRNVWTGTRITRPLAKWFVLGGLGLAMLACDPSDPDPFPVPNGGTGGSNSGGASSSGGNSTPVSYSPEASEVRDRINEVRARGAICGTVAFPAVGPLTLQADLQSVAQAYSEEMATHDFFAHTSPVTGSTPLGRIQSSSYRGNWDGEDLGKGYRAATSVVAAWEASEAHCRVMMSANATQLGVGYALDATGSALWTLELGHP